MTYFQLLPDTYSYFPLTFLNFFCNLYLLNYLYLQEKIRWIRRKDKSQKKIEYGNMNQKERILYTL